MEIVDIAFYPNFYSWFRLFATPFTCLNLFGSFVIWKATPKQFQSFRRSMLLVQFVGLINDISLTYVGFVIFAVPTFGGFFLGPLSTFGISTGAQYCVLLVILSSFGHALVLTLFDRQQSIVPKGHWSKLSKRTQLVLEVAFILCPFYLLVPGTCFCLSINRSELAILEFNQTYPEFLQFYENPYFLGFQSTPRSIFTWGVVIPYGVFFTGIVEDFYKQPKSHQVNSFHVYWILKTLALVVLIALTFRQLRPMMSARTLKLQWKLARGLIIQFLASAAMFLVPSSWFALVYFSGTVMGTRYNIFPTMFIGMHSVASTIVLLTCYESYRRYVLKIFLLFGASIQSKETSTNLSIKQGKLKKPSPDMAWTKK